MGQMLMDGVKAVVLGMGMVYVFLIIMIFLMNLMSKLLAPYANFLVKEQPAKKAKAVPRRTKPANSPPLPLNRNIWIFRA